MTTEQNSSLPPSDRAEMNETTDIAHAIDQTNGQPTHDEPVLPVMPKPARSNQATRIMTAAIGIPIVLSIVWLGGPIFVAFIFLLAFASLRELTLAARQSSTPLLPEIGYPSLLVVMSIILQARNVWKNEYDMQRTLFLVIAALCAIPVALLIRAVFRFSQERPASLASVALTHTAVLYVTFFAFLPLLHALPTHGWKLFWMVLLGVWTGDTAAYFAGRAWGKLKLTPLSPGKTLEGAAAGFAATLVVCLGLTWSAPFEFLDKLAVAVLVAVFAPLGDLVESFWKRELNVKDLGSILPGHGGVLDRCDSLLFATPPVYFYALWRIVTSG
jgi:phosphatidate cytidylyltransferase